MDGSVDHYVLGIDNVEWICLRYCVIHISASLKQSQVVTQSRTISLINCKSRGFWFLVGNNEGRILGLGFNRRIPRNGLHGVKGHDADNVIVGPNSPGKQSKH